MEQLLNQILNRVKTGEEKLMKFVAMVSQDMKTIGATVNAQSNKIAALERALLAQGKTLAGFNELRVGYSPQPIGAQAPMGRTSNDVAPFTPMSPRVVGHETPNASQAHDAARAMGPAAHQNMPSVQPRMSEEDAIFFSGGEDD